MAPGNRRDRPDGSGPVLYLEDSQIKTGETFCTEVFDDAQGEYRVVQLASAQLFDSLRDALNVQLEHINGPSEAAVIITTPAAEADATVDTVAGDTPLYGYRVNPEDLTGISVAFSRLLEKWEDSEGSVKICLRDVESLFPYHDTDLIYRFLNTILATLQGAGAQVHVHLRPSATDDRLLQLLTSLFSTVVEPDEQVLQSVSASDRTGSEAAVPTTESREPVEEDPGLVTMADEQIDAFLKSEGHGVLSFGGTPPYSIPMSYGYDAADRICYLQLSSYEESEKQARLDGSDAVSLVVSRYASPDTWQSVIVDGVLRQLSEEQARDRDVVAAYADSKLASIDVFERDLTEISFDWYALTPTAISGRRSVREL